MTGPQD